MPSLSKKVPITVMIGGGSKLPAIIKAAVKGGSNFFISLVVSHKAESPGIQYAINRKIPAVYFKLPDYRNRLYGGSKSAHAFFMKTLGWFITQREYSPKLLVFAGWDLIMDKNFFDFFKCNFGEGYAAINLHPALMPQRGEGKMITLPDGSKTPLLKGEQQQVLEEVIKRKLTYFGPSVHFMIAEKYDVGQVIRRESIKVDSKDTVQLLRKKLMPVEDKILVESINEVISKYLLSINH